MTAFPILIGIGSNLSGRRFASPLDVCLAAVEALEGEGLAVLARSRWFESAPVPASEQPWYVNGVIAVSDTHAPEAMLALLHRVEASFGRVRHIRNEARILDLDLLAYENLVRGGPPPLLPHPRMDGRAFVLLPLRDIAPDWRHPADGRSLDTMIAALPTGQAIRPMAGAGQD